MMAAMAAILKVFNCYLLPNSVGWSGNLVEGTGADGDLELLKWFPSDVQDGYHGNHLENLPIISAPKW